ncbi:MAG: dockerin type I repeat-containing protein [Ruminococcus sp.]|nr:dockerin type I repeat-containing protein [Ruminococcus sp.]
MKKTDKTAITAALFAAAMGAAAAGGGSADAAGMSEAELSLAKFSAVYGPPPDYYYTDIPVTTEYDPFEVVPQPDYGPIYIYTTTAAAPEETTPVTELIPQPAYGPMWTVPVTEEVQTTAVTAVTEATEPVTESVTEMIPQTAYGPPLIVGDLTGDGEVDTFDFVRMRSLVSSLIPNNDSVKMYCPGADMNGDDDVNVADLVTLGRYVIGRPVTIVFRGTPRRFNEGSEYNRIPILDEDGNYVYDPFDPLPQPAYGPPIYVDPVVEPSTLSPEDMRAQPVYGPPNDYIVDPTEEIPTKFIEEPTFQAVYGPPSYFGLEDK